MGYDGTRCLDLESALLEGYSKRAFSAPLDSGQPVSHDIYEAGSGPVVIIIQELPGIGPETLRNAIDHKGPALAYRFEGDKLCTASKFESYGERFNDDRERIRLVTLPGPGHSVLTLDFVDEAGHPTRDALDEVIDYFKERLA